MGMRLVIAEKPTVAKDIAAVLHATKKEREWYAGDNVIVTWAFGHLVEFADPGEMKPEWGGPWRMDLLPMIPERWQYAPIASSRAQLAALKRLLRSKDVDEVVCATDAGREGELIFRRAYDYAQCTKPAKRLWISSLTPQAIREGFSRLKALSQFDALAASAEARARADWLVGLNLSRAHTLANDIKSPVGRVQTPTLALLVRRQREIRDFVAQPYWQLVAELAPGFKARLVVKDEDTHILDRGFADEALCDVERVAAATVSDVVVKSERTEAPPLYDLLTLQRDANRTLGFSAARTLELAQALYERAKAITYPRTESRHISTDMVPTLPLILDALADRFPEVVALGRSRAGKLTSRHVNDNKLTDHHAIIPTPKAPSGLSDDEEKLYGLVCTRFLAIFLPALDRDLATVRFDIAGRPFIAKGVTVTHPGWTIAQTLPKPDDDDEPLVALPALKPGQGLKKLGQELVAAETKPPKAYTDATLLAAMKGAGRLVDDSDLAAYMAARGLGTAATRAETIEKLIRHQYVERHKKALAPTPKGEALIDQVHKDLADPVLTARWEARLAAIEDGKDRADAFERDVAQYVRVLVDSVRSTPASHKLPDPGLGPCPACHQGVIRATPKGFGCSRWKQGCAFVIWREIAHKTITPAIAQELLAHGRTKKLAGFKGRKGPFTAALRINDEHKVAFEFA